MIPGELFLYISGIVVLETFSQLAARFYYDKSDNRTYLFVLACLLYVGVIFLLVKAYDFASFAIANALWDSGTILSMALLGWLYFGEVPTRGEIVGMSLVVAGALVIGFTSNGGKKENN